MPTPNLLVICGTAFLAVFVVLAALAAVMRVLIVSYPQSDRQSGAIEPALVAAVVSAVTTTLPGTTVAGIEEMK